MAKIIQVLGAMCYWDATRVHPTLASTEGRYALDILFVEAPDHVFEGWGYDETEEGEARFIQPQPADNHWLYDTATGTFYPNPDDPPEGWTPPVEQLDLLASADERILELEYEILILKEGLA